MQIVRHHLHLRLLNQRALQIQIQRILQFSLVCVCRLTFKKQIPEIAHKNGADVHAKNGYGDTALQVVKTDEIKQLLNK
mgnify:CR=1 FL=1